MQLRRRSEAADMKLRELKNSQIMYKRICFNNNDELRLLTHVKKKEAKELKEEKLYEIEVKTETVETSCFEEEEDSALLIHFPNDVFEVTSISKVDDLLDSLLYQLSKTRINYNEILLPEEKDEKDCSVMLPFDDIPNFEDAEDHFDFNDCEAPILENLNPEATAVVKDSKPKLTRLDLIDGSPSKYGPNKCRLCKKISPNMKAFYKHLNSKHFGNTKAILCEFCAMRFTDNQKLLRHCRAKHGLERDNSFPCTHCPYRALDKEQLDVHERRVHTKERPFVCDNCGAGFFSKRVLIQHSRNHTDDKPFQCDKCPSKFKTRQRLCGHTIKIHLRRYTFACPLCDKRLSKAPYMRRHLQREHGLPADRQPRLHKLYLNQ